MSWCLLSLICIAIRQSGKIARRVVKANNRLEGSGSTPAAQPERYAHDVTAEDG